MILICFFIDFVKIHRYNKGNLILWKSANRSGIDDRSAIFRKINFPVLSKRISTKSMKCSLKNKGSPLARRSKNCKFAATEELSFSCMFYRSNGPRQKKTSIKSKIFSDFVLWIFFDFINVFCFVPKNKTLKIHR